MITEMAAVVSTKQDIDSFISHCVAAGLCFALCTSLNHFSFDKRWKFSLVTVAILRLA